MTVGSNRGINESHDGDHRRRTWRADAGIIGECHCGIRRCRCISSGARSRSTSRSRQEMSREISPFEFPSETILETLRDSSHGHEHQDSRDLHIPARFEEISRNQTFSNMEATAFESDHLLVQHMYLFDQRARGKYQLEAKICLRPQSAKLTDSAVAGPSLPSSPCDPESPTARLDGLLAATDPVAADSSPRSLASTATAPSAVHRACS
jgi:hypothetical protein